MMKKVFIILCVVFSGFGVVQAGVITKSGTFNGLAVYYKVVLPDGFDPSKSYPAVLFFAGGSQGMLIVEEQLQKHCTVEAEKRGYLVFSPAASGSYVFFDLGDQIFPSFLEQILHDYKIKDRKFHGLGRSNGGLSAFHVASLYPQYFLSVTGFPGFLMEPAEKQVSNLKSIPLFMHVGSEDYVWREEMQRQFDKFLAGGFMIKLGIEAGLGHVLDSSFAGDGAKKLFDEFEQSRAVNKDN